MFGLYAFVWYLLTQTAWGRHVYAIGNNRAAARLVGIPVENRLLSVYAFAAFLYRIGAWLSLERFPNADPNALQTANLDSITAVVIGGPACWRKKVFGRIVGFGRDRTKSRQRRLEADRPRERHRHPALANQQVGRNIIGHQRNKGSFDSRSNNSRWRKPNCSG